MRESGCSNIDGGCIVPSKEMAELAKRVSESIRVIEGFPKPGIRFRDVTTFISNGSLFREYILMMADRYKGSAVDYVVGVEARGFIIGSALAVEIGCGFIPIRKQGKLPGKTISCSYSLEYGLDSLAIHEDAFCGVEKPRVVLVDDLLATGGTSSAALELVESSGASCVEFSFLVNLLEFSEGDLRKRLESKVKVFSLIKF